MARKPLPPADGTDPKPGGKRDLAQSREQKAQEPKPKDPRKARESAKDPSQARAEPSHANPKDLSQKATPNQKLASHRKDSSKSIAQSREQKAQEPKPKDPRKARESAKDPSQTRAENGKDPRSSKPKDSHYAKDPKTLARQDLAQDSTDSKNPNHQSHEDPKPARHPTSAKDPSLGFEKLIGFINSGTRAQIAPYFQSSSSAIFHEDCLEILARLPSDCVDMIFADPPYMLSNDGFTCKNGRMVSVNKGKWDKSAGLLGDLEFHRAWIAACRRVLKPSGTIWISGTYHSIYSCGFLLQEADFLILNDIAWLKPNAAPNLSCRYFTASHETLIWARKDRRAKHIFNYSTMKNGNFLQDKLKKPNTQMRSVWSIPTPPAREKTLGRHPTQKPLALLERVILASTNPGDVVLDPFSGAGTTALAAKKLGRLCIGVDLNRDYCELAKKRLVNAT